MLELMVSVCLISDPARCKDVALTYSAENLTPMQCMMGAQPEIAKWIEAHPKVGAEEVDLPPGRSVRQDLIRGGHFPGRRPRAARWPAALARPGPISHGSHRPMQALF